MNSTGYNNKGQLADYEPTGLRLFDSARTLAEIVANIDAAKLDELTAAARRGATSVQLAALMGVSEMEWARLFSDDTYADLKLFLERLQTIGAGAVLDGAVTALLTESFNGALFEKIMRLHGLETGNVDQKLKIEHSGQVQGATMDITSFLEKHAATLPVPQAALEFDVADSID